MFFTPVKDTSPPLNWIKFIHFHIQAERDESADVIIFFHSYAQMATVGARNSTRNEQSWVGWVYY